MSFLNSAGLFNAIPDAEGLHEWLLDEGSGTTAADRVADADLSLSGPSWESGIGVGDYVLDFDGSDDEGVADSADLSNWGDTGAVMLQFYPRDFANRQSLFRHQTGDDRLYCFLRPDATDDAIDFGLAESLVDGHGLTTNDLNPNAWNGLILSWDTGDYDAFVYDYPNESFLSGSGTYSGSLSQVGDLYIGSEGPNERHTDAKIDFPRLFDSPLDSTEAQNKFEELARFYE